MYAEFSIIVTGVIVTAGQCIQCMHCANAFRVVTLTSIPSLPLRIPFLISLCFCKNVDTKVDTRPGPVIATQASERKTTPSSSIDGGAADRAAEETDKVALKIAAAEEATDTVSVVAAKEQGNATENPAAVASSQPVYTSQMSVKVLTKASSVAVNDGLWGDLGELEPKVVRHDSRSKDPTPPKKNPQNATLIAALVAAYACNASFVLSICTCVLASPLFFI